MRSLLSLSTMAILLSVSACSTVSPTYTQLADRSGCLLPAVDPPEAHPSWASPGETNFWITTIRPIGKDVSCLLVLPQSIVVGGMTTIDGLPSAVALAKRPQIAVDPSEVAPNGAAVAQLLRSY